MLSISQVLVGGLGFEFCVFVAGWRHALRSEWPFIIITSWRGVAGAEFRAVFYLFISSFPLRSLLGA